MKQNTIDKKQEEYPGEIGLMYKVAYQWIKEGDRTWCAWCGIDVKSIADTDLHIKSHIEDRGTIN